MPTLAIVVMAAGGVLVATQSHLSAPGSDGSAIGSSDSSEEGEDGSTVSSGGETASGNAGSSGPSGASGGSGSSGASDTGKPKQSSSTGEARNPVVAWILSLGPGGGVDFPEEAVYFDLLDDCLLHREGDQYYGALKEEEQILYQGAAAACRAAFHGESENWRAAEAALVQLDAMSSQFTCLGDVAFDALREVVAVHATEPTAQIKMAEGKGRAPACPRIISVEPDHGPASGGYTVDLRGQYLPAIAEVHFGDDILTIQTDGTSARLTVPAAPEGVSSPGANVVDVWVPGWYQDQIGQGHFEYVPDELPSGGSASDASPSTSPGENPSLTATPSSEPETTSSLSEAESPAGSEGE